MSTDQTETVTVTAEHAEPTGEPATDQQIEAAAQVDTEVSEAAPADADPAPEAVPAPAPQAAPAAEAEAAPTPEAAPAPAAEAEAEAEASPAPEADAAPAPQDALPDAPAVEATPIPSSVPSPAAVPAAPAGATATADASAWGRVAEDGTVFVRTSDGERPVGSYPGASEQDALAYFGRKYEDLAAQVGLLEQRIAAGHVTGGEAETAVRKLVDVVTGANAVGDLEGLGARLEALQPLARAKRAEADRARQQARARAVAARTTLVEEAEALAAVEPEQIPWKTSGDRLRDLFEQWKQSQRDARLDKHTEDDLWKRFSAARTTFDRKRRQHFGALDEQRSSARAEKEKIVAEAEALSGSTDWASTATAYRHLMDRWKASPRGARKEEDALWARFRAAQDVFFAARTAANDELDAEFRGNLAVKEQLLAEAEALLPVRDHQAARSALRSIQDRWDEAGKVPRADIGRVEARLKAVETAVRDAESERWTKVNPQAKARAEDAVTQLETTLAGLRKRAEAARVKGDQRALADAEQSIAAREEWLAQARRALADFGG